MTIVSSSARPLIVILAGAPRFGVRRSASAMADALTEHADVLFVDPTASSLSNDRPTTLTPTLNQINPHLWHLESVALPAHTRGGVKSVARYALRRAVRSAIASIDNGAPTAVLLQTPQMNLLGSFDEHVSVYWSTDSFAAGAALMGVDQSSLETAEALAAQSADLVVAVTPALAEYWRSKGADAVVIRNGVDTDLPLPPRQVPTPEVSLRHPIAGVVGTLSSRLDFDILEEVAASGVSVLLVGPASFRTDRSRFDSFCATDNVQWLGPRPHTELGSLYGSMDVGLVPYTLSEFNLVSAPLKPLEYLAMGLPVVSTRLPGVVAIDSPDITICDPASFASETIKAAKTAEIPDLVHRRRTHAEGWSWSVRARELLSAVGAETD